MKTKLLSIALAVSTMCSAQQIDTVKQDSIVCLDTKITVHLGAAAFIIFYTAASQGNKVKLFKSLFRKEDINE